MVEPAPKAVAKMVITNIGDDKLELPKANVLKDLTLEAL